MVDLEGPVPVWIQVYTLLRKRILDGEFQPGRALPSRKSIGQQYGVAESTAVKAIRRLADEGMVEGVQGRGTFVTQPDRWQVRD